MSYIFSPFRLTFVPDLKVDVVVKSIYKNHTGIRVCNLNKAHSPPVCWCAIKIKNKMQTSENEKKKSPPANGAVKTTTFENTRQNDITSFLNRIEEKEKNIIRWPFLLPLWENNRLADTRTATAEAKPWKNACWRRKQEPTYYQNIKET